VRFKDCRFTRSEFREWVRRWPDANFAVVTGAVSNIVGIDTDDYHAEAWAARHLPRTLMMTRSRHGFHRFYRKGHADIRNRIGLWTPEGRLRIDIKSDGGLLMAPGSVHPSGFVYQRIGSWPPVSELPPFDACWFPERPVALMPRVVPRWTDRLERARRYLDAVPGAVEGQGGDVATFRVAAVLIRDFRALGT
jgi:hypothetical protein